MSRTVPFDILVIICAELAATAIREQEREGKEWDSPRFNDLSRPLLKCSLVSKGFREAVAPHVFKTIDLVENWPRIRDRMSALKDSTMLRRYVRTVRVFPPKWIGVDLANNSFRSIFRDFGSILSKLPSLQALAITTTNEDEQFARLIEGSFVTKQFVAYNSTRRGPPNRSIQFPKVTDLSLSDEFGFVLQCFPNLQRLTGNHRCQPIGLLGNLRDRSQLQSFTIQGWATAATIQEISQGIPDLGQLRMPETIIFRRDWDSMLWILATFQHLQNLQVGQVDQGINWLPEYFHLHPDASEDRAELIFVDQVRIRVPSLASIRIGNNLYTFDEQNNCIKKQVQKGVHIPWNFW